MIDFEQGYLFGKRLGTEDYVFSPCVPSSLNRFGIIKYKYENADYLMVTKEELEYLNDGNFQWIDHDHMAGRENEISLGKTIGDAIINFGAIGVIPDLYLMDNSGRKTHIVELNADSINKIKNIEKKHFYYKKDTGFVCISE